MIITFDLESFPIAPGLACPRPVVAGVKLDSAPVSLLPLWCDSGIRDYFTDSTALFLGHNIAYDFSLLAAYGFLPIEQVFELYRNNQVRDTMIREQLIDIATGRRKGMVMDPKGWRKADYKLATLETLYTGKDRSADKGEDAWRLRYGELFQVPLDQWPEDAVRYVKEDVDATYNVYVAQKTRQQVPYDINRDPEDETRCVDEHRQVYKAWCLRLVSCWGVRTDASRVKTLEQEVTTACTRLEAKMLEEGLYKWGGTKKAPKLTKNMAAIKARTIQAYEALGEPVPFTKPSKRFPQGQVKTDADALAHSGDELLEELGGGGPLNTVRNTFLPELKKGVTYPIHTSYDALKNTGRTSSYKPNLANIPRSLGVRECFKARDGHVFISVDWAAAELRANAQISLWLGLESPMAQTFQADPKADPHAGLAKQLMAGSGATDFKKARQDAKAANFGYPGGMREKKFVAQARKQGMTFSPEEATKLREAWLEANPDIAIRLDRASQTARRARNRDGYSTIIQPAPWVKQGKLHRVRGGLDYSDLLNTVFQGLVADAFGEALTDVAYACYCDKGSALYGTRPVFALYDEIILEAREEAAHEAALELTERMIAALNKFTPDVPAYAEPALMYRWSKKAEAKYVNERLVAWDGPVQ